MGESTVVSKLTWSQMWLNLSEDECRGVGAFATDIVPAATTITDEPLVDVSPDTPPEEDVIPTPSATTNSLLTLGPSGSLFQSLANDESDASSDSDEEPNMNKVNESWAALMLELEALKAAAGTTKGKGKKSKGQGVILETPSIVKLKSKIARLEKDYMFSKKDAGMCT